MTMSTPKAARGFSLVEVMVALIVIAIGMLGIAKMQGLALSSTGASRSRALAAIEASSLASAMQANRAYWSLAGSTPGTITVTTLAGGTPTITSTNAAMGTAISNAQASMCSGTGLTTLSCYCASGVSAPCTPSIGLAGADVVDWGQTLAAFLPSATATVTCNNLDVPVDCKIFINWLENTVAVNSQQASYSATPNGSTVPVSYALYVVP
jgi:type IV pilus assembly protein PilV